jgi:hypothetical protein
MEYTAFEINFLETWRPAVGYEGRYEVSDIGRVRHSERKVPLAGQPDTGGYPRVGLRANKGDPLKMAAIHLLVLTTFVGPCPPGWQCRHLDGNRRNARLSNLKWGTPAENLADKRRHFSDSPLLRMRATKLSPEEIQRIRDREHTVREARRVFGVSAGVICGIRKGRTHTGAPRAPRKPREGPIRGTRVKLTPEQVAHIRELACGRPSWGLLTRLAKQFGVASSTITAIKQGKTWSHVGEAGS